jgi:benzoyl-CoA reductase/2-hydroxyglutaryl-CoA dehydratase subunit BcrC/BadD/HgdB
MTTNVDLIQNLRNKFDGLAALLMSDTTGQFPDRQRAVQMLADYLKKIHDDKKEGKQLAWINYAVASELFWAMDITPVVIDVFAGITSQNPDDTIPYIDKAENFIPDYICSVNKVFLGMALSGDIPQPDMIVVPSHPCDSNLASYPVIAEHMGFPYYCIDAPYFKDERGLDHVTSQMKGLVSFLEEQTGRKLDHDKLREAMEHSNRAHEYILKIAELAQSVPSPFSSMDGLADYAIVLAYAGTPELADYMEMKYEAVKKRVEAQQGQPTDQRIRLVWIYGAPAFDFTLFFTLEQVYGAYSVGNMNNNFIMKPVDLSSPESIYRGLASKVINLPMGRECGGPWENYVDAMMDLCRRFKADAAVLAGHVACKANWPIMKLVKDRIADELGIPTLLFEIDLMDPRICSGEDIKRHFDEFFKVHFPDVMASLPPGPA